MKVDSGRLFPFNKDTAEGNCPACGKAGDGAATLVIIAGTQIGGNTQAIQIHLNCLLDSLMYFSADNIVMAKFKPRK